MTQPIGLTITGFPPRAKAITPSDSVNLTDTDGEDIAMHVFVGVAGNVKVLCAAGGDPVTFTMPAGGIIPVQVIRVYSTDTTSTGLVGLY